MRLALVLVLLAACGAPRGTPSVALPRERPGSIVQSIELPRERVLVHDAFDGRQRGELAPASWSMLGGVWYASEAQPHETVRFGDSVEPGLDLLENTAIRLGRPFTMHRDARYRIRARVDPVVGEVASLGWVSIGLATDPESSGWVTSDMLLGLLVRSRGAIQVFTRAIERDTPLREGAVSPQGDHLVELELDPVDGDPPRWRVRGSVDGLPFEADLLGHDPALPVWLSLGAHFHQDTGAPEASRVAEITVTEIR